MGNYVRGKQIARGADGITDVNVDTTTVPTIAANNTFNGNCSFTQPLVVANPVSGNQAAPKSYVDSLVSGITWKDAVRLATTANITLSGLQTIDGVSGNSGDRILVKNQTTATQNGIYTMLAGSWTRTADANTSSQWAFSVATFAEEGTANGNNGFVCTTAQPITLGTTAIAFTQFTGTGEIIAGNGLTKTGNEIDVAPSDASLAVSIGAISVQKDPAGAIATSGSGIMVNTDGTSIVVSSNSLSIAAQGVTMPKLARGASGALLIGQGGSNTAYTVMSGDATITNAGVLSVAANAITLAKFARSASAGQLLIGQGSSADSQYATLSGDATINGSGVITVSNGAITAAKIAANTITGGQLARSTAGNILIAQGAGSDITYNAVSGDATLSSSGVLTVTQVNGSTGLAGQVLLGGTPSFGFLGGYLKKTANYTAVAGDNWKVIDCDATGGAFAITLPAAATIGGGYTVWIRKTDSSANAVTVTANAADGIDLGATGGTYVLNQQFRCIKVTSTGVAGNAIGQGFLVSTQQFSRGSSANLLMNNGTDLQMTAMSGDATISASGVLALSANVVTTAKLARGASGALLIGQGGSDTAYTAMSGDATITNAGVLTIANLAVTAAKMANNTITGAQMARSGSAGQLLIGQGAGSDTAYTTVSGDATLAGSGALTIANNAITAAKINTSAVGNGLTGGGGTALAVLAQNTSIAVSSSGVKAAVPVTSDKNIAGVVTASDFDPATAAGGAIASTPAAGEYVRVDVNGVGVSVGDGNKTHACYFSGDGGTTARAFSAIVSGDRLYWVGSVAGYQLDASDILNFHYAVA